MGIRGDAFRGNTQGSMNALGQEGAIAGPPIAALLRG